MFTKVDTYANVSTSDIVHSGKSYCVLKYTSQMFTFGPVLLSNGIRYRENNVTMQGLKCALQGGTNVSTSDIVHSGQFSHRYVRSLMIIHNLLHR